MRRFAAIALLALVLVGIASVVLARGIGREVAVQDAVARGKIFARGVAAPLVDGDVLNGTPRSTDGFAAVMNNRLREGSMRHLKLWNSKGVVLWSDQEVIIGRQFELEPDVERLFDTGGAVGQLSTLEREENVAEQGEGPLLEVYAAAPSATGEPVVVESYWSTERIDEDAQQVMLYTVPLVLGALGVFALLVFPLARSLARRVERTRDENTALLRRSLAASDLERMRIARDLHDGVMQDVSGAGYALSAALGAMDQESEKPRRLVEEVSSLLRGVGESLRSTLVDIYPTDLARDGLRAAVEDLAVRTRAAGVEVRIDVSGLEHARLEVVQLCYRMIREGLRNVERHARAQHVVVSAARLGDVVRVTVEDDGVGWGSGVAEDGHLGLKLLQDTFSDVGGALTHGPGHDGGTVLVATFPLDLRGGR